MKCYFLILILLALKLVQCHPLDDPNKGGMTLDTCLNKLRQTRRQVERAYRAHLSHNTPDTEREIANLEAQVVSQRGRITYLENREHIDNTCPDHEDFALVLEHVDFLRELESQFSTQQSYIVDLENRVPEGHVCPDQEAYTGLTAQVEHQRNYIAELENKIRHMLSARE